jgi:serine phosphatase RsbU (regulator of sigma subunit)/Tfp pilus assembly protein PilF
MKGIFTLFFSLSLFFCLAKDGGNSFAQQVKEASEDSVKVRLLFDWDDKIYLQNSALDIQLNTQVIDICRRQLARKNIRKKEELFYASSLARALNNKGLALSEKNRLDESLIMLHESYEIARKYKIKLTESHATNNIGTIYRSLKEYKKAIRFYEKSFAIFKDSAAAPETFNNIGLCYSDLGEKDKAMRYFELSLKFSNSPDHQLNKANTLLNLADLYFEKKDHGNAMHYFSQALETNEKIDNPHGVSYSYCRISNLLRREKKYAEALLAARKGYSIAKKNDLLYNLQETSRSLYNIHKEQKHLDSALYYYELYNTYVDQYTKQTNREELLRKQFYYEYQNKEELAAARHKKQLEVASEKNKRQRIVLISVLVFFLGMLIFVFFVVKSYRRTKKMNQIIEMQKKEVEHKNREILDSISYAKRIQTAILPPDSYFKSKFKQSFILYMPKDIVAGDFYWLEERGGQILFAVADCTGHGVPGAMVSVVCHNALNRCIREFNLTKPNEILNKTREIIIHEFEKSREEVKDGMDISLCCLDLVSMKITWAGANNPLCIIRNKELIEFKGDKQPIGNYSFSKSFSLHEFQLQKDDVIYLFSDGYIDQFGGTSPVNGKKFKSRRLKTLLSAIAELDTAEQKTILEDEFHQWKGSLDQVDDICIIGIKI